MKQSEDNLSYETIGSQESLKEDNNPKEEDSLFTGSDYSILNKQLNKSGNDLKQETPQRTVFTTKEVKNHINQLKISEQDKLNNSYNQNQKKKNCQALGQLTVKDFKKVNLTSIEDSFEEAFKNSKASTNSNLQKHNKTVIQDDANKTININTSNIKLKEKKKKQADEELNREAISGLINENEKLNVDNEQLNEGIETQLKQVNGKYLWKTAIIWNNGIATNHSVIKDPELFRCSKEQPVRGKIQELARPSRFPQRKWRNSNQARLFLKQ
jgi:hypothetical protein